MIESDCIRLVRTTQELRANQDWPARPKRRGRRLPTAHTDLGHTAARSWKAHRHNQRHNTTIPEVLPPGCVWWLLDDRRW